ncbi:hypothetical protein F511_18353 [Dorcoceras hygrometricum]|uniref:Uncharacterized protein n=1 Tax=Dorcoceras hygrometricum TaxID=472368 RepID=A0A2Z7BMI1_9LAMI|nr:hypothetical protein F511_18353 [Dorcoceras hygrometricum]
MDMCSCLLFCDAVYIVLLSVAFCCTAYTHLLLFQISCSRALCLLIERARVFVEARGEMRYGSYPLSLNMAITDLSSRDKCVYATDAMFNTETYTIHKAYTAASIITHAQSKAVKQAHIRTSSLLCYNYYNRVPSNEDLTPAKPKIDTNSGIVTQKPRIGSYKLNPSLSYPSNTTEGSKQSTRLEKGDVLAHLTSFKQASKSSTKRSVLARGVHRYHSHFNRSYLPSAIGEDKWRSMSYRRVGREIGTGPPLDHQELKFSKLCVLRVGGTTAGVGG